MKFDFESLSAEPLFYMLMHSGAFVCVLGAIFFVIGLLFGYATWGRYKRQTRQLLGEASSMKDEIANTVTPAATPPNRPAIITAGINAPEPRNSP